MEKYGTPEKKEEMADGTTKVAAQQPKECCKKLLDMLLPDQSVTCSCGNPLTKVSA